MFCELDMLIKSLGISC